MLSLVFIFVFYLVLISYLCFVYIIIIEKKSPNISRIIPSINRCKTKIQAIEQNGKVWDELEKDLPLPISRKAELKVLLGNMQILFARTSMQDSHQIHVKYSQHSQFLMWIYFQPISCFQSLWK